jgi:hypothetical protein
VPRSCFHWLKGEHEARQIIFRRRPAGGLTAMLDRVFSWSGLVLDRMDAFTSVS